MIFCCNIIDSAPDYILQELFHTLILGISTLIVAIITSWIFKRKDELTRIEGVLLEKKLEIYRQLSDRLQNFLELHQLSSTEIALAKKELKQCGFKLPTFYHVPTFMLSDSDKLTEQLMDFDRQANDNMMYYDDYTAWPILVFQNYNTILVRFHAIYRDGIINAGGSMTNEVKEVEADMFRAIGLIIYEEWGHRVEELLSAFQTSVNNLSLKHRKAPLYNYQTMQDPDGPLMQELQKSILIQKRTEIMMLISSYIALGMIAFNLNRNKPSKKRSKNR